MRFNKLMGLGPIDIQQDLIEGSETRMLEGHNASMTTATTVFDDIDYEKMQRSADYDDDALLPDDSGDADGSAGQEGFGKTVDNAPAAKQQTSVAVQYYGDGTIGDYSMSNMMDQQLMKNIEQYVLQNMSRGQISLDEMATAMGMGRVPFFHKIRSITTKTPAEVVRELRLKHACTLLVSTNINMSELAINVGFMTADNFINIFKEKFGMTPLEYRLKNKRS